MELGTSSPMDPREGRSLRETPPSTTGKATSAAMIYPLAMAWAYLDAIAKTWLAFGEKLHGSFYRNSHRPKESDSAADRDGVQQHLHQHQHQLDKAPVNVDDVDRSDSSGGGGGESRLQQHQPNRLEFCLGDFLAPILHRTGRSGGSSTRRCNEGVSSSSRLPQSFASYDRSDDRSDDSSTATAAASSTSWPLRLRQHMASSRCNKQPRGGLPTSSRPRATDKTLVLDLDETLIYARKDLTKGKGAGDGRFDFLVVLPPRASLVGGGGIGGGGRMSLCSGKETSAATDVGATFSERRRCSGGGGRRIFVRKRPNLKEFLQAVAKEFEVVVFTAARAEFANAVLNEIDPRRELIDHVLSRESCARVRQQSRHRGESKRGTVVKDLGIIGRPLSKVSEESLSKTWSCLYIGDIVTKYA